MKRNIPYLFILFFLIAPLYLSQAQQLGPLTVEKIMRDPKWIGTQPSGINWSQDSQSLYFSWNPEGNPSDSLYKISPSNLSPVKVSSEERNALASIRRGIKNREGTKQLVVENGKILMEDLKSGTIKTLVSMVERASGPSWSLNEEKVIFTMGDNLFSLHLNTGELIQITDFQRGNEQGNNGRARNGNQSSEQDEWLERDQMAVFEVLQERNERRQSRGRRASSDGGVAEEEEPLMPIYTGAGGINGVSLSPDEKYVAYTLVEYPFNSKRTEVPTYVTESGYTEMLNSRPKVGSDQSKGEMFIFDREKNTTYPVNIEDLPGLYDKPDYWNEYPQNTNKEYTRDVFPSGPFWSEDGKYGVVQFRSSDNKDRWIMLLDPETGGLSELDRQRDEAWIGGPGVSGWGGGSMGWMPDNKRLWFMSEESGYAHLYTVDVSTGQKQALTSGKFEIYGPVMSLDKKFWYFTSNEVHPGERHFYKMPINGGERTQITTMEGNNEVSLSPDEKHIAIRFSYSNRPWELYYMPNKAGAESTKITDGLTEEWKSHNWMDPEVITFEARDGADVYARLYKPRNRPTEGSPAVIFVHGAGYLQNAHKWWSNYFREYMFHNLLAEQGYTVLDIDYRASAGYGRDWRTAIYRHMGGWDLNDNTDGAKFMINELGVDPESIGIYGGSYGGFITLMALFNEPEVFKSGAALRAVTDWAHYNHGYTSNILNTPVQDSLSYARSSPLYFAEGLKGNLLIAHGMVDTNVHFQDVVRLAQRLIELEKDNWEMAVYPLEDHGFIEPSSWTDEYKRILKLFNDTLKKE